MCCGWLTPFFLAGATFGLALLFLLFEPNMPWSLASPAVDWRGLLIHHCCCGQQAAVATTESSSNDKELMVFLDQFNMLSMMTQKASLLCMGRITLMMRTNLWIEMNYFCGCECQILAGGFCPDKSVWARKGFLCSGQRKVCRGRNFGVKFLMAHLVSWSTKAHFVIFRL